MLRSKYFWATLTIIAMWVAVLVVGVAGGSDFAVDSPGGNVRIPAAWGVALFALIGTTVTAAAAFREGSEPLKGKEPPAPQG